MENPEEVLQALEEFQKMRPTEIPRELDEYINFVAKTGDSVYQWPLVKPLFREKLVRVMTDFYESCPTLDLASSPNIDHFNYDNMKCNLLDLLESFANAPFTIQRLCELLTSPRKEYNRVDKFMRAIEKNILVVSTREPGTGRRSENGDSMVNGTIDDETSINQQSHEVEMEAWEKDCTTADQNVDNISLLTPEQNVGLVETIIPSKITKESSDDCQNIIEEKDNIKDNVNVDTFIPTSHEILSTPDVITSSLPSIIPDSIVCTNDVENLTTNISEVADIVGDVPEAIINEDTSSQPISETDNDDNDSSDNQKLQTTFQSKDFPETVTNEKTISQNQLENEEDLIKSNVIAETTTADDNLITKNICESKSTNQETQLIAGDDILNKNPTIESNELLDNNEIVTKVNCSVITTNYEKKIEPEIIKSDNEEKIDSEKNQELKKETVVAQEEEKEQLKTVENISESIIHSESSEITSTEKTESKNVEIIEESITEASKPIIEEPVPEEKEEADQVSKKIEEEKNVVIEEAMDDDTKVTNIMVPDPIPIVEEPKDETTVSSVKPIDEYSETDIVTVEESIIPESCKQQETSNDDTNESKDHKVLDASVSIEDIQETTNIEVIEKNQPTESMEVDNEDSCQQDEPMEEESPYQTKS